MTNGNIGNKWKYYWTYVKTSLSRGPWNRESLQKTHSEPFLTNTNGVLQSRCVKASKIVKKGGFMSSGERRLHNLPQAESAGKWKPPYKTRQFTHAKTVVTKPYKTADSSTRKAWAATIRGLCGARTRILCDLWIRICQDDGNCCHIL